MSRWMALFLVLIIALTALTLGSCDQYQEKYDRKMRKMEFRKQYLDSMRRKTQRRKDSLRQLEVQEQNSSSAPDSVTNKP